METNSPNTKGLQRVTMAPAIKHDCAVSLTEYHIWYSTPLGVFITTLSGNTTFLVNEEYATGIQIDRKTNHVVYATKHGELVSIDPISFAEVFRLKLPNEVESARLRVVGGYIIFGCHVLSNNRDWDDFKEWDESSDIVSGALWAFPGHLPCVLRPDIRLRGPALSTETATDGRQDPKSGYHRLALPWCQHVVRLVDIDSYDLTVRDTKIIDLDTFELLVDLIGIAQDKNATAVLTCGGKWVATNFHTRPVPLDWSESNHPRGVIEHAGFDGNIFPVCEFFMLLDKLGGTLFYNGEQDGRTYRIARHLGLSSKPRHISGGMGETVWAYHYDGINSADPASAYQLSIGSRDDVAGRIYGLAASPVDENVAFVLNDGSFGYFCKGKFLIVPWRTWTARHTDGTEEEMPISISRYVHPITPQWIAVEGRVICLSGDTSGNIEVRNFKSPGERDEAKLISTAKSSKCFYVVANPPVHCKRTLWNSITLILRLSLDPKDRNNHVTPPPVGNYKCYDTNTTWRAYSESPLEMTEVADFQLPPGIGVGHMLVNSIKCSDSACAPQYIEAMSVCLMVVACAYQVLTSVVKRLATGALQTDWYSYRCDHTVDEVTVSPFLEYGVWYIGAFNHEKATLLRVVGPTAAPVGVHRLKGVFGPVSFRRSENKVKVLYTTANCIFERFLDDLKWTDPIEIPKKEKRQFTKELELPFYGIDFSEESSDPPVLDTAEADPDVLRMLRGDTIYIP